MKKYVLAFFIAMGCLSLQAQKKRNLAVLAYYTGRNKEINTFEVEKLTHIIYSFCHLKDGKLNVSTANDSITIKNLVLLKAKNPKLKIMLALGGWGGCEKCSDVFSTASGRADFAKSVKETNDYFKTDGFDLDWEYPSIEGSPGYSYQLADKKNFTELMKVLRAELGKSNELSFAAGGFQKYLDESVEWELVMPLVDRVNIMSYDLVGGYSKVTGHQTPLYSVNKDEDSADKVVEYLLKLGINPHKIVIGAAFYTRTWKNVENINNGLYQPGVATDGVNFNNFKDSLTEEKGWKYFWDEKASASYWYNEKEQKFASSDDVASVKEKTSYVIKKKLGGIMFWELGLDTSRDGVINAIYEVKTKR